MDLTNLINNNNIKIECEKQQSKNKALDDIKQLKTKIKLMAPVLKEFYNNLQFALHSKNQTICNIAQEYKADSWAHKFGYKSYSHYGLGTHFVKMGGGAFREWEIGVTLDGEITLAGDLLDNSYEYRLERTREYLTQIYNEIQTYSKEFEKKILQILDKENNEITETNKCYTVIVMDNKGDIIGEMEIDKENVNWSGNEFSSVIQTAAYATEEEM